MANVMTGRALRVDGKGRTEAVDIEIETTGDLTGPVAVTVDGKDLGEVGFETRVLTGKTQWGDDVTAVVGRVRDGNVSYVLMPDGHHAEYMGGRASFEAFDGTVGSAWDYGLIPEGGRSYVGGAFNVATSFSPVSAPVSVIVIDDDPNWEIPVAGPGSGETGNSPVIYMRYHTGRMLEYDLDFEGDAPDVRRSLIDAELESGPNQSLAAFTINSPGLLGDFAIPFEPFGALDDIVAGRFDFSGSPLFGTERDYAGMGIDPDGKQVLRLADLQPTVTGNRGLEGDERMVGTGRADVVLGGGGDDLLIGKRGRDVMHGADGDDEVQGGAGGDRMWGGSGLDRLDGGNGNDRIDAGAGNDTVLGGGGRDTMVGGAGNDLLKGGGGNDLLRGDKGRDRLEGGAGDDRMFGGAGNEFMLAGKGDDRAVGGAGNDVIYGQAGDDTILGGSGGDQIAGDDGDDILDGGAGSDFIIGDEGDDELTDGGGQDRLTGDEVPSPGGRDVFILVEDGDRDRITDFEDGIDTILLPYAFDSLRITQQGIDVHVLGRTSGGERDLLILEGVQLSQIGAEDFV